MSVAERSAVLPWGTVTFLFTDVKGSTRLWAADKEAMSASLLVHDSILRSAIEGNGGLRQVCDPDHASRTDRRPEVRELLDLGIKPRTFDA